MGLATCFWALRALALLRAAHPRVDVPMPECARDRDPMAPIDDVEPIRLPPQHHRGQRHALAMS